MSLGKTYFLNILGVDNDYIACNHIQVRRKGEKSPFAEILEKNGQAFLRVGNPYPEPAAIRVVVDDQLD